MSQRRYLCPCRFLVPVPVPVPVEAPRQHHSQNHGRGNLHVGNGSRGGEERDHRPRRREQPSCAARRGEDDGTQQRHGGTRVKNGVTQWPRCSAWPSCPFMSVAPPRGGIEAQQREKEAGALPGRAALMPRRRNASCRGVGHVLVQGKLLHKRIRGWITNDKNVISSGGGALDRPPRSGPGRRRAPRTRTDEGHRVPAVVAPCNGRGHGLTFADPRPEPAPSWGPQQEPGNIDRHTQKVRPATTSGTSW